MGSHRNIDFNDVHFICDGKKYSFIDCIIGIPDYIPSIYEIKGYFDLRNGEDLEGKLSIKRVIFNNPATIVYWEDGSKTVVKAENELFDREKGLAMAIAKKALGNKGSYFNEFRLWIK